MRRSWRSSAGDGDGGGGGDEDEVEITMMSTAQLWPCSCNTKPW